MMRAHGAQIECLCIELFVYQPPIPGNIDAGITIERVMQLVVVEQRIAFVSNQQLDALPQLVLHP